MWHDENQSPPFLALFALGSAQALHKADTAAFNTQLCTVVNKDTKKGALFYQPQQAGTLPQAAQKHQCIKIKGSLEALLYPSIKAREVSPQVPLRSRTFASTKGWQWKHGPALSPCCYQQHVVKHLWFPHVVLCPPKTNVLEHPAHPSTHCQLISPSFPHMLQAVLFVRLIY